MRKTRLVAPMLVAALATLGPVALAHPDTHTVSVGGSIAPGSHLFFASDIDGADFSVKRLSDGIVTPMSCAAVSLEGEVHSGTGVDPFMEIKPVSLGNAPDGFDGSERSGCIAPLNLPMSIVQTNEWEVHALGTATSSSADLLPIYLSGPNDAPLQAHVYATSGGPSGTTCNFIVEGYVDGTFDEAGQVLTFEETGFSGDLTIVSAAGDCLGLTPAGSVIDVVSSFEVGSDSSANTVGSITDFHPILLTP